MPRRKIVRTFEEEEEFQRNKRERKAKSQRERREIKRIAKKDSVLLTLLYCSNSLYKCTVWVNMTR